MIPTRLRVPFLTIAFMSLALILIFAPIVRTMVIFGNDYPAHIYWAIGLDRTGQFEKPLPQFLYHVMLILISHLMPGINLEAQFTLGAVVFGVLCYLTIGLIVFYWLLSPFVRLPSRWRWPLAIGLTLTLMLVGPINELTWSRRNLYWGYIMPNAYHNPTVILSKPFALLIFAFALRIWDSGKVSVFTLGACTVIAVLGVFAKPNYSLALLPALMVIVLITLWKRHALQWRLLTAIIVPIVAALAWQYVYYGNASEGGFEFAPLKAVGHHSPEGLLPKLILSIAFPAVVYLLYWRQARQRLDLNLAWLVLASAAAQMYLLAEKQNSFHANFIWGAQVALFILMIVSALFLLQQNIGAGVPGRSRVKLALCLCLLLLHLVGGVALYLPHLNPQWENTVLLES